MSAPRYWAVVPAAGVGRRMGATIPKQYLALAGQPIIERTLRTLLRHPRIAGVMVAVSANDEWWPGIAAAGVMRCDGGEQRCHSVLNGLRGLGNCGASFDDWALVHDAVRPLLRAEDIDRLMDGVDGDGGLLALPVRDTMKRMGADNRVQETVSRERLWHALTPQMFPIGALVTALGQSLANNSLVTDEAQAMEMAGARPRLVEGHADNIKITHPDDLELAERLLRKQ